MFPLKIKLIFLIKIVIFSKKLLCKVPIFCTHRLGGTKVYQKEKKKVGVVIEKPMMTSLCKNKLRHK
jgi:hypothetical protein